MNSCKCRCERRFVKKTQKTPAKELKLAKERRADLLSRHKEHDPDSVEVARKRARLLGCISRYNVWQPVGPRLIVCEIQCASIDLFTLIYIAICQFIKFFE